MTNKQFGLGMGGIFLFACLSHFWRLHSVPVPVFDEIYYTAFAHNYLTNTPFFDAHPPLGKYMIALGLVIGGDRWMNAVVGTLLPIVVTAWLRECTGDRWLALLGGMFTALDGYLLVESRLNLINIYIIFFGILSQWLWWRALQSSLKPVQWFWIGAAGMLWGCAIGVKWNGVAYGIGLVTLWIISPRRNHLSWLQGLIGLIIIPILTYGLLWFPHLQMNPDTNFWEIHQQILSFHLNLGKNLDKPVHPYCSPWWTWPWLLRPIAYFYEEKDGIIQFMHGLGNPFLYWLSALAVIGGGVASFFAIPQRTFLVYLLVNFAAHYFPWGLSQRCTFLYHYLPASVFALCTLAVLTAYFWQHSYRWLQELGATIPPLVFVSFLLWSPLFFAIPIPYWYYKLLIWLPSWV